MEIQHLYSIVDEKKQGMYQYIYWYHPDKELEENEIIKSINAYKYVVNNISQLEEWSGLKDSTVLYDSDIDGKESSIFRKKIMKQSKLYFIVIDSNDNVFGHYHPGVIDTGDKQDENIFLFTLNSNGRCEVKKFDKKDRDTGTYIQGGNHYYSCSGYSTRQIDTDESFVDDISDFFEGIEKTTLTGNYDTVFFTTRRLIVIQMK